MSPVSATGRRSPSGVHLMLTHIFLTRDVEQNSSEIGIHYVTRAQ
jgi:site-specific recombinase